MSLDASEIQKLKAEAAYFAALTRDLQDKSEFARKGWSEKLKKWSGTIIAVVSVCAGIWGLLLPINKYIEEKQSALKYELNSQMVDLLEDMDSDSTKVSDRSIMLLSYYERNSLPILFYKLERVNNNEFGTLVTNIAITIANIYESGKKNKEAVNQGIISRLEDRILKIKRGHPIGHYDTYTVCNLLIVIQHLKLSKKEAKKYLMIMQDVENDVNRLDPKKTKFSLILNRVKEIIIELKDKTL